MDYVIQIAIAIIPAIISYFAAVKKSNIEIEKLNVVHKHELEKMEKELENQKENKKNDMFMDIGKEMLSGLSLDEMMELRKNAEKYNKK